MTKLSIAVLAALCAAAVSAQSFNLDAVAAKAKEKAEVTLEGPLLEQALQNAPDNVKSQIKSITRLIVRHYEFEKEGEYSDSDLADVRKIVTEGSGWSSVLKAKEKTENVEIYVQSQDGKASGFLLIAEEPKELTVVEAAGTVDLARLQELVSSAIKYDLKATPAVEGQ
jgi:Domain of unknown function (DUF4252)